MKEPNFSVALLHPRYWLTWLGMGVWALVAQLPFRIQMGLGALLGKLFYHLAPRRRKIAERNLELCFPEKSKAERDALVREHFVTNGLAVFETGMAWFMPRNRFKNLFVIKGIENWQALVDEGRGALVIGLHFNTLEIANIPVNQWFTLSTSYRAHANPVYDWIQFRGRERHGKRAATLERKDLRGMVKLLKSGGFLWYAPDQDYGRKVSEFVPWFGVEAATIKTTPKLLKMADVPAISVMYRRLPGYRGYEINFLPPIENLPSGDDRADLATLNRFIENCVKENLTEYLWVHRRFKTRPPGEPDLYKLRD